jgi:hypothetical protein
MRTTRSITEPRPYRSAPYINAWAKTWLRLHNSENYETFRDQVKQMTPFRPNTAGL